MLIEQEQRALLERFIVDNPDLEALEAKISHFNIFEAVGMVRQEIKHSNFLQFLLDPAEKHQLGDLFLKNLLLQIVHGSAKTYLGNFDVSNSDFADAEVERECRYRVDATASGQWCYIDLLIYSPRHNFVCVIENKVDSVEGFNQLQTYQSVIGREFSKCKKLFVYLTKAGDPASLETWVSLSYATIADVIDCICQEKKATISADVEVLIRHYSDLIRRHFMNDSETIKLCRKIYRQYRQAIDLIYENRSDLTLEIEEYIQELIREFSAILNIELDSVEKQWIRFALKEWDQLVFQKTCDRWTSSRRLLMFEFWNEPSKLELRLVIGPCDETLRQSICTVLKTMNVNGLVPCSQKPSDFTQACIIRVLSPIDYESLDSDVLKEEIRKFWLRFINGDLKTIRQCVLHSFSKT
jgi:hypothetical protein